MGDDDDDGEPERWTADWGMGMGLDIVYYDYGRTTGLGWRCDVCDLGDMTRRMRILIRRMNNQVG